MRTLVITDPALNDYMLALTPPRDKILAEMEALAKEKNFPIIGPLCGRFLAQLTMIKNPKVIVEMGSGFGYSAYWFAKAAGQKTKIYCSDGSEENKNKALQFFKRGKIAQQITYTVGNALDYIDTFKDNSIDMILNDVDKEQYPSAFAKAVKKLKPGGLLVTDNALWSGKVLQKNTTEAAARGVMEFNRLVYSSKQLFTTILPLRDGLAVCVKR
jgi:caffeoyl-CoA O-methyltransferase